MKESIMVVSNFVKSEDTVGSVLTFEAGIKEKFPIWQDADWSFFHKSLNNDFGRINLPATVLFLNDGHDVSSAKRVTKMPDLKKELEK